MASSSARDFRWLIPPLAALVLLMLSLLGLLMIGPAIDGVRVPIAEMGSVGSEKVEMARAVLVWAGTAVVMVGALLAAFGFATATVARVKIWDWKNWLYLGIGILGLMVGVWIWGGWLGEFGVAGYPVEGVFEWSMVRVMRMLNLLTALAIVSLLAGAGSLIYGVRLARAAPEEGDAAPVNPAGVEPEWAAARLKWILGLGALATMVGVIEIGLGQELSAFAVQGSTIGNSERAGMRASIDSLLTRTTRFYGLDEEAREADGDPEEAEGGLFMVKGFLASRLEPEVDEAVLEQLARRAIELIGEGADSGMREEIIDEVLLVRDRANWRTMFSERQTLAKHYASFWGLVFSLVLILLYVPTALFIIGASKQKSANGSAGREIEGILSLAVASAPPSAGAAVAAGAGAGAKLKGLLSFPKELMAPLTRVLLAFAPFMVGGLAEILKLITEAMGSGG